MPGSTGRGYPYPLETDSGPDVAAAIQSLATAVNADMAGVEDSIVPLDASGASIAASNPGDTKLAGTTGKAADAGHRHAREATVTRNFPVPFYIANTVTAGLKAPKFIVTANATLRSGWAVLDSGSAVTYQVYVNGAAATGMTTSPAVGTAVSQHDFADVNVSPGDLVQINVISGGNAASGLSVTLDAVWR